MILSAIQNTFTYCSPAYMFRIVSRSESFYSVLLQTQEASAKTISGRCRRGHLDQLVNTAFSGETTQGRIGNHGRVAYRIKILK